MEHCTRNIVLYFAFHPGDRIQYFGCEGESCCAAIEWPLSGSRGKQVERVVVAPGQAKPGENRCPASWISSTRTNNPCLQVSPSTSAIANYSFLSRRRRNTITYILPLDHSNTSNRKTDEMSWRWNWLAAAFIAPVVSTISRIHRFSRRQRESWSPATKVLQR